jgi:hypothetical protein
MPLVFTAHPQGEPLSIHDRFPDNQYMFRVLATWSKFDDARGLAVDLRVRRRSFEYLVASPSFAIGSGTPLGSAGCLQNSVSGIGTIRLRITIVAVTPAIPVVRNYVSVGFSLTVGFPEFRVSPHALSPVESRRVPSSATAALIAALSRSIAVHQAFRLVSCQTADDPRNRICGILVGFPTTVRSRLPKRERIRVSRWVSRHFEACSLRPSAAEGGRSA